MNEYQGFESTERTAFEKVKKLKEWGVIKKLFHGFYKIDWTQIDKKVVG